MPVSRLSGRILGPHPYLGPPTTSTCACGSLLIFRFSRDLLGPPTKTKTIRPDSESALRPVPGVLYVLVVLGPIGVLNVLPANSKSSAVYHLAMRVLGILAPERI